MKTIIKFKMLMPLLFIALYSQSILAQSKADIFDEKTPVTWLGLDYTQAKFIPAKTESGSTHEVTNSQFTQVYIPAWNYLFMIEGKKFNVAKSIHRPSVAYAIGVTEKVNSAIKKDFYTENQSDFKTLTEQNISDLVKNYDFQGNTGIGLLFFIEGMSRPNETEGAWVTFVDMKSKTVLFTSYLTGKTGGVGFRNNWADATFKILKQIESDYEKWGK
ncbi:MAG: hypothetical protein JWQ63_611 [Mucilaginibacter sp.]|nr:hypothetical protein [Mucilaginibacter sp.]